jgi:hypothetical protein
MTIKVPEPIRVLRAERDPHIKDVRVDHVSIAFNDLGDGLIEILDQKTENLVRLGVSRVTSVGYNALPQPTPPFQWGFGWYWATDYVMISFCIGRLMRDEAGEWWLDWRVWRSNPPIYETLLPPTDW